MARRSSRRSTSYTMPGRRRMPAEPVSLRPWLFGGAGALILGGLFFWYMATGGWGRLVESIYNISADAGLKVEEVFITGRTYLSRDEVLASINVERGTPILAVDLQAVHERLAANAWVDTARVERHLPNVLYVALIERKPYARWQNAQKLYLVDAMGVVLSASTDELARFPDLPLIVGPGAPQAAESILTLLREFTAFRDNLDALVRVGDRRWDLRLNGGLTIKLPETDEAAALNRVANLAETTDFAAKGIKVIDARLPDRLIIDNSNKEKETAQVGGGT